MENSVKEKIINLLQKTENIELLQQVYSILDNNINFQEGEIWNNLSVEERNEIYLSAREGENPENLIDHEEAIREIRNKLGWS